MLATATVVISEVSWAFRQVETATLTATTRAASAFYSLSTKSAGPLRMRTVRFICMTVYDVGKKRPSYKRDEILPTEFVM